MELRNKFESYLNCKYFAYQLTVDINFKPETEVWCKQNPQRVRPPLFHKLETTFHAYFYIHEKILAFIDIK